MKVQVILSQDEILTAIVTYLQDSLGLPLGLDDIKKRIKFSATAGVAGGTIIVTAEFAFETEHFTDGPYR